MAITPFTDTPTAYVKLNVSGGMDTTAIDQFRQGHEIVNDHERYSRVFFRLTTGESNNAVTELNFGQVKTLAKVDGYLAFQDNGKLPPSAYVQVPSSSLTLPFPVGEYFSHREFENDGAIDPFDTRQIVMGNNIDFPFPMRGFKGYVGNGNSDIRATTDQILQITTPLSKRVNNKNFFVDQDGLQNYQSNLVIAFDDASTEFINTTIRVSSSTDSTIRTYLYNMSGSTSNMLLRHEIGTTSGFTFDDNNVFGVDSLAFAGFQSR
jgi:hypothetical protein